MFENIILFLALQVLVSYTESQLLLNPQPRSYMNYDQRLHPDAVKPYPGVPQPLTLQTQIQSISTAPKCTAIPSENIIPNKIVTNPLPYNYDNNLNNYENSIRKYGSMTNNPNVVNNYYILPQETHKRKDYRNRNLRYNDKVNRNKGGIKRRKKENCSSHDEKENKRRYYRHDDDDNKRNTHELQGEFSSTDKETKRKRQESSKVHENDMNESDEIEKIIKEELEKIKKKEKNLKQKEEIPRKVKDRESKNLGEKEKFVNFDDIQSNEEKYGNRKHYEDDNRKTRNLKSTSNVETKHMNPQEEFNKYFQNMMSGNLTYPYYTNDMFPYNFDSFYKTLQTGESAKPKSKDSSKRKNTRKSNQNSKKRNHEKKKEDECDTVIELTPTYYESTPITISTGKGAPKDIYLNLKIKKTESLPNDKSISTTESHVIYDDEHSEPVKDNDEIFNNKPLTITLYEPIEDNLEYYPDFTLLNHAYLTSSEEEELHSLQNNHNNALNDWDYYADKVKSYVEHNNKKQAHRAHAGLENPDFVTTIVNKKDKPSSVSKNIETVFAPSRVVSYSQPSKMSQNDSEEDEKNLWCKDGDTTIVFARSIDR